MDTQRGDLNVLGLAVEIHLPNVFYSYYSSRWSIIEPLRTTVQHDGDSLENYHDGLSKQYYGDTNFIPKELLLPMDSTDRDLLKNGLQLKGQNVSVSVPQH